ncbi:hypothetical protein [Gloeobacter violaceus]|uniref:Gll1539 protein n=1 Tax=Gloeobacter violaceus (strain ATCC 29082 / PCC 7421) TaxID=251221 RepID=Q7NKD9_GLOVI|nr:hypothetical protein [Gloeobacter violaceus]BAC89480.1 gll1539 [Gloeobacter violaceus PCC 7421]
MDVSRQQESSVGAAVPTPASKRPLLVRLASLKWAAETVSAGVQVVAIIAAGVWAFYSFIYEDRIKPANEPLAMVATTELEKVGRRGDMVAVQVRGSIRNVGKAPLRLLLSTVNVYGVQVDTKPSKLLSTSNEILPDTVNRIRYLRKTQEEVIFTFGRRYKGGGGSQYDTYLNPEEEVRILSTVLYVNRRQFDQVNSKFVYFFGRAEITWPVELVYASDGSVGGKARRCSEANCPVDTDTSAILSLW